MTIFDIIDGVLSGLNVPFYDHSPEFAEGEDPALFITYDVYDVPYLFGDGNEGVTSYGITINVFGLSAGDCDSLYKRVIKAFKDNEFCRKGGTFGRSNDFPGYYRLIGELTYNMEVE